MDDPRRTIRRPRPVVLLMLASVAAGSCGEQASAPVEPERPDTTVAALEVAPSAVLFASLGDTVQLTAKATNRAGLPLPGAKISWTSSDAGVASVTSQGLLTALGRGWATIQAASGSTTASASVTVEPSVSAIRLSPDSLAFLELGRTQQVTAEAVDAKGNVVPGLSVSFASSNRAVAAVESGGGITSKADGVGYVVASVGAVRDSVPLTVHAIGRRATVSGGDAHTCAIDPAGTAWCWGQGRLGQLGNGKTFISSDTPVRAPTPEPLGEIAAGKDHTCALSVAGSAYCWGHNDNGQLGSGTTVGSASPQLVADTSHFRQVAAGMNHSCGVTLDGRALCWGWNYYGQLGSDGGDRLSPVMVAHDSTFIAVTAGQSHSCALAPSGKAYCWGSNSLGQLGDGTTASSSRPVPVARGLYFGALAAGRDHTCGITTAGAAYCWGDNSHGAIGDGTTTTSNVPRAVQPGEIFVDIDAGASASCGLTSSGAVRCWGYNAYGELGDGTRTSRSFPTDVAVSWPAFSVAVGAFHACAQSAAGDLECWGNQVIGATGVGDYFPKPVFAREGQSEVSAGQSHTCSRSPSGDVFCWGWDSWALLGGSSYTGIPKPGGAWAGVSVSTFNSCAWTLAGKAYCWGMNYSSTLGNGGTSEQTRPYPVSGGITFAFISAGYTHTCGLDTQGRPWCWGSTSGDRAGIGVGPVARVPMAVLGSHIFVDLDAGDRLSCGIEADGRAWCWGIIDARATTGPTLVPGDVRLKSVSVGFNHACGLDEGGAAFCWGGNESGQLGSGDFSPKSVPTPVQGGLVFTSVETKYQHTCGLTQAGEIYCWGWNAYGQLGDGGLTLNRSSPTLVAGKARYVRIAPGFKTTCAVTDTADVMCWGTQSHGQIGGVFVVNPTPAASPPYRVEFAPWWAHTPPPAG